jgi:GTP-binding protein HflX
VQTLRIEEAQIAKELIELKAPVERAILVGAPRKGSNARHAVAEHLEELERLVDTAGGVVVGEVTQQIDKPNPATYLGKGKVEELRLAIDEKNASLIVFDDELSPSQGKNIEDATGQRVMDRAELILDIFATRARSSEAKMQVELAQLQYMLPRLTRMWAHLEKFRGGIGVRGPGETQLETDRRLINQRIKQLKSRLEDVQKSREVQRSGRRDAFRASLVGYTNAGKSSILRAIGNDPGVFVEDRLFATLDPLTREIDLGENSHVLLTDTVGFIRKLPHNLVASFRATLEEVNEADLLLHVIDASHPNWEEQRQVVDQVLAELGAAEKPVLYVFSKIDALPEPELRALRERIGNLLPGNSVFVSSVRADGLEPLKRALLASARVGTQLVEVRFASSDGKLLAQAHREATVVEQLTVDGQFVLRVRLSPEVADRLHRAGAQVGHTNPASSANGDKS